MIPIAGLLFAMRPLTLPVCWQRGGDGKSLMTTHDFSLLPRYADQVVLIDHGVLIQGDPQTVLDSEEFHRTFHMRGGRA